MKKFLIIILCVAGGVAFKFYIKKRDQDQLISQQQELLRSRAQQEASKLSIEEKTQRMIEAYQATTKIFNAIQNQETANQQAEAVVSEIKNIAKMDIKLRMDEQIQQHKKTASFNRQAPHSQSYREAAARLLPFYKTNENVSSMIKDAAPVLAE